VIEVVNLKKQYGDLVAVDGVSFEAKPGGIFGVLGANVLAALGGCWWPIEITPVWMQGLARFLPTGTAMDALHRLVSFGSPATAALPHTIALVLGALVLGWLAVRIFRFQ
jgi:ABC-type multidrug transport system permease subunit